MVKPSPFAAGKAAVAVEAVEGVGAAVVVERETGEASSPQAASPKHAITRSRTNLLNFKPVTSPLLDSLRQG